MTFGAECIDPILRCIMLSHLWHGVLISTSISFWCTLFSIILATHHFEYEATQGWKSRVFQTLLSSTFVMADLAMDCILHHGAEQVKVVSFVSKGRRRAFRFLYCIYPLKCYIMIYRCVACVFISSSSVQQLWWHEQKCAYSCMAVLFFWLASCLGSCF